MSTQVLDKLPETMPEETPAKENVKREGGQKVPPQGPWQGKFVDVSTKDGRRVGTARVYRDDDDDPWQTIGKLHDGTEVNATDYRFKLAPCQSLPEAWGADAEFYSKWMAGEAVPQ